MNLSLQEKIIIFIIIIIISYISFIIGSIIQNIKNKKDILKIIKIEREDAIKKSRHVLTGQFSEQISPYLPNFPALPSECKFLGAPIDFICFKGLDNKNVEEIIFIEVKSQNAKLNGTEKTIKNAILNKKVKFIEYRVEK